MPHGLGHFVGLDVHDTSVYPTIPLETGNALTIEPGIYFNEVFNESDLRYIIYFFHILNLLIFSLSPLHYSLLSKVLLGQAIQADNPRSTYLNAEKISEYLAMKIGGVRIEDVVVIVDGGYEIISSAAPTILGEIEDVMA